MLGVSAEPKEVAKQEGGDKTVAFTPRPEAVVKSEGPKYGFNFLQASLFKDCVQSYCQLNNTKIVNIF